MRTHYISPLLGAMMAWLLVLFVLAGSAWARDLDEIKYEGTLRHLGVPHANFVDDHGSGLDAELMQLFAKYIGVTYQYVPSSWNNVFNDLLGRRVQATANSVLFCGSVPVKGDVIANGLTRIPWREKIINYSAATFPSQVWLVTRADSKLTPIVPSGNVHQDIRKAKSKLNNCRLLGKANTCLDPELYGLPASGARCIYFEGQLNELAPAVINGEADAAILDVPDALMALEKWPGQIKVIGPISTKQIMGIGFPKNAPHLLAAFNSFFAQTVENGIYRELLNKYYPSARIHFPGFFNTRPF